MPLVVKGGLKFISHIIGRYSIIFWGRGDNDNTNVKNSGLNHGLGFKWYPFKLSNLSS